MPRRAYDEAVKALASALLLLFLSWPLTAAEALDPFAPIQQRDQQLRQQNQLDQLRRDQQIQNLQQQQDTARVQGQIDNLRNNPDNLRNDLRSTTVQPGDVDRMQLNLNRLQNEQQLKRVETEQKIQQLQQLQKQGDNARSQRQAGELTRQQQIDRMQQRQKLDDIEEDLRRFENNSHSR